MAKGIEKIELDQEEAVGQLPPAPVLLVASGNKEEEWNVTTVGMFNVFSMFPVVVGIGVRTSRNLYRLIAESDDFTLNVPPRDLLEAVEICGSEAGVKKNKFKEAGLTPEKGLRTKSPVIKECWLNLECKKLSSSSKKHHAEAVAKVHPGEIDIGDHTWFLGQIVHAEVWKDYDRGRSLLFWDGEYRLASEIVKGKEE